jgi:hypothetical protein
LNDPTDKVQKIFTNPGDHSQFYIGDPYKDKIIDSITIKTTPSNKGLLHEAGTIGMHNFTI